MRHEGQPSVEEILESIKQVIARDNRAAAAEERRRRETSGMEHVLAPEALSDPGPEPVDDDEAEEILDLGEAGAPVDDDHEDDEDEATAFELDDSLTTDRAADAMRQSLAALAMLADPPAKPQIVRQGETSLEGLVREMLRPMLAQWLDANLPVMVEKLVKAEIARIAGKKR